MSQGEHLLRWLAVSIFIVASIWGDSIAAETSLYSLSFPAMMGPLLFNQKPFAFNAGPLEEIYLTGILSGLGLWQSNPLPSDHNEWLDLSNGQLFIQKPQGLLQFYIQGGGYALPSLGTSYLSMEKTTQKFFGPVPVAFFKLAPYDNFSIMAGKLPTLIGSENSFIFQNMNIEHGLLWNQTNAVNRGVQMNITQNAFSGSIAVSDGFYSNQLSWLSGLVTYNINHTNSITIVASGNMKHDQTSSLVTPLVQNNSQIYDLMYTNNFGRLSVSPTLQFTHVPKAINIGLVDPSSSYGVALASFYRFNTFWSLASRAEYIITTGGLNMAYGPGSNAWSLTLTPTYQHGIFFARGEASIVEANNITVGLAFGQDGAKHFQGRLLIETGVLF